MHLAYRGTAYRGWQRQPGVESVQEQVEQACSQVLGEPVVLTACGRTDAGVHARQFIAHCDLAHELVNDAVFRINKTLPDDIAVYEIIPVPEKAHARYDAISRTYDYFIHRYPDPFLQGSSALYEMKDVDMRAMAAGLALLPQYQDYAQLCKKPEQHNTTLCTVSQAQLFVANDQQLLRVRISANRFLMGMIRMLMHELLLVGQGQLDLETFRSYLAGKSGPQQRRLAYPQGLFLSRVVYPDLDVPVKTPLPSFVSEEAAWQEIIQTII